MLVINVIKAQSVTKKKIFANKPFKYPKKLEKPTTKWKKKYVLGHPNSSN